MPVGGEAWAVRFLMLQSIARAWPTMLNYFAVSIEIVNYFSWLWSLVAELK